jgi:hypothetical protein
MSSRREFMREDDAATKTDCFGLVKIPAVDRRRHLKGTRAQQYVE